MKTCRTCRRELPLEWFALGVSKDGRRSIRRASCTACKPENAQKPPGWSPVPTRDEMIRWHDNLVQTDKQRELYDRIMISIGA